MNTQLVDMTAYWPDVRPGDIVRGVHSKAGVIHALVIDRPQRGNTHMPDAAATMPDNHQRSAHT